MTRKEHSTLPFFDGIPLFQRTIVLSERIDPDLRGSSPLGEWTRRRNPSHFRRLWDGVYELRKGTARIEEYAAEGVYFDIAYESGQIGAAADDFRTFYDYHWCPLRIVNGSPGWLEAFSFEQHSTTKKGTKVDHPCVVGSALLRRISHVRGRERFFSDRCGIEATHRGLWEDAAEAWLALHERVTGSRRGVDILTASGCWGQWPGQSGLARDVRKPWLQHPFRESYFYGRGLGLLGWAVEQSFDKGPYQLMRVSVFDREEA